MSRSIEESIRRAMQEGKFDNLPGRGKPLKIDENPHEDPEWRLAHHIMRGGGFTLPWLETRHEIEAALDDARTALKNTWDWRQASKKEGQSASLLNSEWKRAQDAFQEQITALNKYISDYNLSVPSGQLQLPLLNFEREVEEITG